MCLHANRDVIAGAGFDCAYPGRDDSPSGDLALSLPSPRHGWTQQDKFAARVARKLKLHSPDVGRALILSEENIPGRMIHFFAGQFYPAAAARLAALRGGLGEVQIAGVLLVIRPYDALFVSAWRKRAEDRLCEPFAPSVPYLMAMEEGWPELVAHIRTHLAPARLHVVDYAARGPSEALLQRLVPEFANLPLAEPRAWVNESATDAALEVLQGRYAAGEKLDRASWQEIVRSHENDLASRGLAEFSAEQTEALQARYARDLDALHAMDGVELTC
jgi:hypothetical protein